MLEERPITEGEVNRATGRGVRVLIIDSGVAPDHPALGGKRRIECWHVEKRADGEMEVLTEHPKDVYGHGTAVAAILSEHAPGAEISSLRVLGGDMRAASHRVVAALNWAIDRQFDIINCSFGTPNPLYLADYKQIVDRAYCKNVMMVAACNNFDFRTPEYPGCFPSVISTDYAQVDGLAVQRRRGHIVEFAARGAQLKVAWANGEYRTVSGSSFAAPHLAALVARLRELRPGWTVCETKAFLYRWAAGQATTAIRDAFPAPERPTAGQPSAERPAAEKPAEHVETAAKHAAGNGAASGPEAATVDDANNPKTSWGRPATKKLDPL